MRSTTTPGLPVIVLYGLDTGTRHVAVFDIVSKQVPVTSLSSVYFDTCTRHVGNYSEFRYRYPTKNVARNVYHQRSATRLKRAIFVFHFVVAELHRCKWNIPTQHIIVTAKTIFSRALRRQEGSNTARYDTVCVGCPTWVECDNCTVRDSNLDPTCTNALQHTSANEAGSTLESLRVESGYWRATARSSIILACYNNAACLGGQTGTETFCDDGYTGPCEWAPSERNIVVTSNDTCYDRPRDQCRCSDGAMTHKLLARGAQTSHAN